MPKPLGNRLAFGQGVVAEELDDAVQRGRPCWLEVAPFPVNDRELGDFQNLGDGFLGKLEQESTLADMIPNRFGLEISFLWFQCLKPNGHELQKSNASLHVWLFGALLRQMPM